MRRDAGASTAYKGLFITILVLGLSLRLYHLADQDYWFDELYSLVDSAGKVDQFQKLPRDEILEQVPRVTMLSADRPWYTVWESMRYDSHPPLYFLLLRGWRCLYGDDELSVRLLPAMFSVLTALPLALMLRTFGFNRGALWLALLSQVCFVNIRMGQENRQYALALLLATTAMWAFVTLETRWTELAASRRRFGCVIYVAAVCAALLTHYLTALPIIAQLLYVLLVLRGASLRRWLFLTASAGALFAVVWLPSLLEQIANIESLDWLKSTSPHHVRDTFAHGASLPLSLLIQNLERTSLLWAVLGAAILLTSMLILWRARHRAGLFFGLCYFVPVGALAILDLATGSTMLQHLRYPYYALPGLLGMMVLSAEHLPRFLRTAAPAALGLICLLNLSYPTHQTLEGYALVNTLDRMDPAPDLLIFDEITSSPWITTSAFLSVSHYLPELPYAVVMLSAEPQAEVFLHIRQYKRIALVMVAPTPKIRQDLLESHGSIAEAKIGLAAGDLRLFCSCWNAQ